MKKSVKGIIGLTAVLAVLGGGLAALMLTEPKDEEDGSSISETEETGKQVLLIHDDKVTGIDPDTGLDLEGVIKTVNVKNQTDELHVVQKTTKTEETAATYTLDGYQDIYMNDSVIGTMAHNANGMMSEDVIEENCTDLAKFGLASPVITVDIEYETGTKYHMAIGNEAPSGGVTYVMINNEPTVYTVTNSLLANYSKKTSELVETTILKAPDEYPIVKKLTLERDDLDTDIVLEYDEKSNDPDRKGGTSSSHVMTKPTFAYLAVEKSTDIISGMFGLYANDIYAVHCTDAEIAEAGLKDPFCSAKMECDDGNTYTLLLSEPFTEDNGKSCYCMLKGGKVIFTMDAEKAKWLSVEPVDIASRIFLASYVWNITDLTVSCGDKSYDFDIMPAYSVDTDPDKLTSYHFKTTLNGEEFETERYRQFYSFLISANAENFALDEPIPSGKPMASLKYTDSSYEETVEVDFYEKSNMQALIVINGESKFTITKSFVDTLIENANNIESDKEFITTWK